MNNIKTGKFIALMRKENNLTQKQLAEQLGVTDKAISKWERGLGYPDIETLMPLAKALGVTANEILSGSKVEIEAIEIEKVDRIVTSVVDYSEKMSKKKIKNISQQLTIALTSIFSLAIIVCAICNIAISRRLDWAYYPIGALVVAWFTIIPLINYKKYKWLIALAGLTVSVIPYLYLLQSLTLIKGWVNKLALPIAVVTIVYFLLISILLTYVKLDKWYFSAAAIALIVPHSIIVNTFIESYAKQKIYYIHNVIGLIAIAIILGYIGYCKKKGS